MSRHDMICYAGLGVVVLENVLSQALLTWMSRLPEPPTSAADLHDPDTVGHAQGAPGPPAVQPKDEAESPLE